MTTVIVYLEHIAQADLDDLLSGYQACRSPIHDRDVYKSGPHAGETKKPHWHIVFQVALTKAQKKRFNNLCGLSENFLHQDVEDGEKMLRYLCHEDNPEKAQYNKADIMSTDVFDWDYCMQYKKHGKQKTYLRELCSLVIDNEIFEYSDYMDLLLSQDNEELVEYGFKHESKIKHLIDSRRYKALATHTDRLSDALMKEREINHQMLELLKYITTPDEQASELLQKLLHEMYTKE